MTLTGTVGVERNGWTTITCPDAPKDHLKTHNMRRHELKGARPGDRVELTYHSTNTYGLWSVTRVIRR